MTTAFLIHMVPHVSPLDFSFFSVKRKFGLDILPAPLAGVLAVAVSSNGLQASFWIMALRKVVVPCVWMMYVCMRIILG